MSVFESETVARERRNWLVLAFGLMPLFVGPVMLLSTEWAHGRVEVFTRFVFGSALTLIGILTSLFAWRADLWPVPVAGRLVANDEGVSWNGRLIASRASLRAGFLLAPPGRSPRVRLERRWRRAETITVPDEPTGRALLRALGLDASQVVAALDFGSRARMSTTLRTLSYLFPLALLFGFPFLVVFRGDLGAWVLALLAVLWAVNKVVLSLPTRVVIGADGVLVAWLGRRRFVPYSLVRLVTPLHGPVMGVALLLPEGRTLKLPIEKPPTLARGHEQITLVVQRIQQAVEGYRSASEAVVTLPERRGRPVGEWIRLLRSAGSGAVSDYRAAPLAVDKLIAMVEDRSADPQARATAAVALGGSLDAEAKVRLRVAAEATAGPNIRRVLELAAREASEEELGEALIALEG